MEQQLADAGGRPGVILAGGLALRMGGADKCLLRLGDATLLDRIVARLAPQCGPMAISANGDAARFARFGLPVLADTVEGHPGPLAGILAALDWAAARGARTVLTAPGDTPFLPADLVERLAAAAGPGGSAIAASPDPTGRLRRHPACGLWQVALRVDLRRDLAGGLRKVGLWADAVGASTAAFGSEPIDPFFNVNTPDDLDRARSLADAV